MRRGRRWLVVAGMTSVIVVGLGVSFPGAASTAPGMAIGLAYMTGHGTLGNYSVWLAGANGRGAHRLGPGFGPLLSPDGRYVAALDENTGALVLYSRTGVVVRRFFMHPRVVSSALVWSRDSRYLAVRLQPPVSITTPPESLAVIDAATGRSTTVAVGMVQGAGLAPTGTERLVYRLTHGGAGPNLYEAWINSQRLKQLTHDGRSLNPLWERGGSCLIARRCGRTRGTRHIPRISCSFSRTVVSGRSRT